MAQRKLLDTQGIARISRLELVAKQAVEGFISGKHPSPYHGSSVEYADHRPYTLSDEIRAIDWKLLAKTDKYYIKLFEEQTNVRATILLDASRSMAFGSGKADEQRTKFEYASLMAAALAYLMLRQSDAVGLVLFDNEVRHYLPPRSTATHLRHMLDLIEQTSPQHETRVGPVLHEIAGRLKHRGMIILISDLLDDVKTISDGLAHFRYHKHEVLTFQVMDPAEMTLPYERLTRFKDMEGHGSIVANPNSVRKRYLERLQRFLASMKQACLQRDIMYELAQTDRPYHQMLASYLEQRGRMRG